MLPVHAHAVVGRDRAERCRTGCGVMLIPGHRIGCSSRVIYCVHQERGPVYLLRRHLLPITAQLRASLVLAYAFPAEVLNPLLAPGLRLDTYGDLGFLAIALVEARSMRPVFVPAGLGLDFFLAGYRIFARYQTGAGRNLRGLRILRSDTDRRSMQVLGNLLTHYGYERSRCHVRRSERIYDVNVCTPRGNADLHVEADVSADAASPPAGSPFPNLREARKFAGPLPYTFDYERQTHSIIRVEGVRQQWNPRPVSVTVYQNTFLEQDRFRSTGGVLANAFYLENVPYTWKPGIRESLQ
jgi:Uncharacterized conserved protein (COG2071)